MSTRTWSTAATGVLALVCVLPGQLVAQEPVALTLEEALPQARQNNPSYLAVHKDEVAAEDTRHQLRGERLRLTTDIGAAHLRLATAYQAVQMEEANGTLAGEQLEQARDRYGAGLDSYMQLREAETVKSQADQAYLAARYTFHEALADQEAAAGQPLRPEGR